jgi:hypothetical protein
VTLVVVNVVVFLRVVVVVGLPQQAPLLLVLPNFIPVVLRLHISASGTPVVFWFSMSIRISNRRSVGRC